MMMLPLVSCHSDTDLGLDQNHHDRLYKTSIALTYIPIVLSPKDLSTPLYLKR